VNPRIQKLSGEIEKTRAKISEMQARLRDLERQKTDLENSEYVEIIRSLNMTPEQLAAFLKKHTYQSGVPTKKENGVSGMKSEQEDTNGIK